MVKGDAIRYRKGIKGKMTKQQETQYRTLLARETKGYAEALAKLKARKARGDFKPKSKVAPKRRGHDQNPKTNEGKEIKKPKFKPEVRSVALKRNAPKLKDTSSSTDAEERYKKALDPTKINVKRDAKAFGKFKPEFIHTIADSGLTDMERSQDTTDSGYFGHNLVQYPTTTTGDEAIFVERDGVLQHPAMKTSPMDRYDPINRELGDYGGNSGILASAQRVAEPVFGMRKDKEGRDYDGRVNENTIVGRTIDRGDNPMSKPRSWEGTKAGGYSKKETLKPKPPMTLEKRLTKADLITIGKKGKTEEELEQHLQHPQRKPKAELKPRTFPNIPILKSVNYIAGKMEYGNDERRTNLRFKEGLRIGATSGKRGCEASNTCSEFYLLNERPKLREEPTPNMGYRSAPAYDSSDDEGTTAQFADYHNPNPTFNPQRYTTDVNEAIDPLTIANYEGRKGADVSTFFALERKGVSKPSELDYQMGLPMVSTKQTGLVESKGKNVELGITSNYGGNVKGVNELQVKEGMSYEFDKSRPKGQKERPTGMKPISKLKDKDLRRLAQNRGIPTTTREKKSKDYDPAKLSRNQLRAKMNMGLPVDMSYDFYGSAPTIQLSNEYVDLEDDNDDEEHPMGNMDNYMY